MMDRISICEALAKWNEIDPFFKRMVTGDEKWVTYDNTVRKRSWSKRGEEAQTVTKPGLPARKFLLCIWFWNPNENSACVEVGTTHKHLRRGVNSNNFNYITCEEVKSVDSQRFSSLDTSYGRAKRELEKKGETYIQFAARSTANFQYYCSLRKVNSFESLCDLIISDKLFETLNKETATHIGIREAEDWFRPIDLAKECDIYISSRSGSHKEIPITYGYTQDPFKNRSQNFKPKIKENYPQYLERENKNCFICGDSSHCARDCEKHFKPKESNDHIHNRINVNTLKIESEKK
ncbi:retrovirus-related Pol polyprotein from transposon 412 [Trichonephila clavipes]|nr:retrovirus-related Pol polyprotein from transposon 412 [Trichonephila clavipes]